MIEILGFKSSPNCRLLKKIILILSFAFISFVFAQDSLNVKFLGGYPFARAYRPTAGIINGHKYCFLTAGAGVLIFNVDDPDSTIKVSQIVSKVDRPHTFFANNLLYLADKSEGLKIYDLQNPLYPELLGICNADYSVVDVFVKDAYAYLVDGAYLKVIDISESSAPYEKGSCSVPYYPNSVDMKDHYVYCGASYGNITVVDVFNPANPFVCFDTILPPANLFDLTVYGDHLFVPDWFGWTFIFDISNAQHPIYCGMVEELGIGTSVEVYGNYLYRPVGDSALGRILGVYDITNVSTPIMVGHLPITESTSGGIVYLDGHIYLGNDLDGLRVINVQDPYNPYETGYYQTPGYAKCVFITNNIAYLGSEKLLSIIDVSDPQNCMELGFFELESDINYIWVQDSYVYATDSIGGLSIIDVSNPLYPVQTGYYLLPSYWGSFGVWVQDTFAYVSYLSSNEGLRVINVADPYNPYEVGNCDGVHCSFSIIGSGSYVYMPGLSVVNVQNPSAPYLEASLDAGFGNISLTDNCVYIAGYDSLYVTDVSEPTNPFLVNVLPYVFGDIYASGNYACGVNWFVSSGGKILSVLDISNPDSIYEVGYYNAPATGYSYGEYVFYDNGHIYVCRWHLGLHIYEFYGTGIEETNAQVIPKQLQIKNLKNRIEFSYYLKNPSVVKVSLIDVLGRVVEKQNFRKPTGNHKGEIGKKDIAAGVYFLIVDTREWSCSEKIVVIK